jgi:hypothetical protein
MWATVLQETFGAGSFPTFLHFRPQYVHVGAVLVEIRLIYCRVTPFERLGENMRVILGVNA